MRLFASCTTNMADGWTGEKSFPYSHLTSCEWLAFWLKNKKWNKKGHLEKDLPGEWWCPLLMIAWSSVLLLPHPTSPAQPTTTLFYVSSLFFFFKFSWSSPAPKHQRTLYHPYSAFVNMGRFSFSPLRCDFF